MEKTLVIAEKPALGKAIADALPGNEIMEKGTIQKGDYTIIWAFGHLLTLKDPEEYDEKYRKWKMEDLPVYFENWGNRVKTGKKEDGEQSLDKRVAQIGKLLKESDTVIHAGDMDEEGQLLVDEILRWFRYRGKVKRLDTSNTAKDALVKALQNMKDNEAFEQNGWSAFGRQLGDKIFGYNLTRYYTILNNCHPPLTVGRVQTPTLGLVVNRDEQIEKHQKVKYYELYFSLEVDGKKVAVKYVPEEENPNLTDGKFLNQDYLKELAAKYTGNEMRNVEVTKKLEKESAPLPFNLTKLNTYSSKKWGMNPDTVMKVTQSLREKYRAITYNRSDCQYLSEEHFKEAPQTVLQCTKNLGIPAEAYNTNQKSRCFNDENLTAHFAIIPTNESVPLQELSDLERKIYEAICNFYLVQFMPPAEREKTSIEVGLNEGSLLATEKVLISEGYLKQFSDESDKEPNKRPVSQLPELSEGNYSGKITEYTILEKETKPPQRYTQGTLFNDMGSIAKYVSDPEMKKLLMEKDKDKKGENGSIGTVATRAMIIKHLIDVGYLEEKGEGKKKSLVSTQKGRKFYHMLPDSIKGADVTAKWWILQEDIKMGQAEPEDLGLSVLAAVKEVIASGEGVLDMDLTQTQTVYTCPHCKGDFLKGKFGFYCKNKCGFHIEYAFRKKLTDAQIVSLIEGKKVLVSGLPKKTGGTYRAYVIPRGVEEYQMEIDGENVTRYRLKLELQFPQYRR